MWGQRICNSCSTHRSSQTVNERHGLKAKLRDPHDVKWNGVIPFSLAGGAFFQPVLPRKKPRLTGKTRQGHHAFKPGEATLFVKRDCPPAETKARAPPPPQSDCRMSQFSPKRAIQPPLPPLSRRWIPCVEKNPARKIAWWQRCARLRRRTRQWALQERRNTCTHRSHLLFAGQSEV